jgi:hypothetical protein
MVDVATWIAGIGFFGLILSILAIVVWFWGLVQTANRKDWLWFILIFIMPVLGSILYLIFGKKKR